MKVVFSTFDLDFLLYPFYLRLKNYQNFLKFFSIIFIFVFCFVILDSFIQFYFEYDIFGLKADYLRLSGPFGEELVLGSYLSRLFPITLGFLILLLKDNSFFRIYIILFFLLTCMAILISNERVPIANMILATTLIIFTLRSVRFSIISSLTIFIFLTSILFISNNKYQYSSRIELIEDRLIQVTRRNVIQYEDDEWFLKKDLRSVERVRAFSEVHEAHYSSALKMFFDNPIFGVGTKNFRKLCQFNKYYVFEGCSTHPHNTYIQLLAETGVLGSLPVMLLFLYLCYFLLKNFN